MLITKAKRIGGSLMVTIPAGTAKALGIEAGDELVVEFDGTSVTLHVKDATKARRPVFEIDSPAAQRYNMKVIEQRVTLPTSEIRETIYEPIED